MALDPKLAKEVRALTSSKDGVAQSSLTGAKSTGGLPAGSGMAMMKQATVAAGAGIASPLTEVTKSVTVTISGTPTTLSVADRTYYASTVILNSSALFAFVTKPIQQSKLTDANGASVVIDWANPRYDVVP